MTESRVQRSVQEAVCVLFCSDRYLNIFIQSNWRMFAHECFRGLLDRHLYSHKLTLLLDAAQDFHTSLWSS